MVDAINTGNPVNTTKFIVNKYEDIDGQDARVNQETPRGRFCFRDTNGRLTLPRSTTEAAKAVYPVDWAKPLNPPPYFEGAGLNGSLPNSFNDGSLGNQETDFGLGFLQQFVDGTGVPAYKTYDIPPYFYDLPVTSGNKCLVFDEGTFTYGSGNYVGNVTNYTIGQRVYADFTSGNEGKFTFASSGTTVIGIVKERETFGPGTITIKTKGTEAL